LRHSTASNLLTQQPLILGLCTEQQAWSGRHWNDELDMTMDERVNDIKRDALEARDSDRPKILSDPEAQPVPDRSKRQRLAYRPLLPVNILRCLDKPPARRLRTAT
jgi:hypothetical protein